MDPEKILVLGGAGFIGLYTLEALVETGSEVITVDSLEPQVHGIKGTWPADVPKSVKVIHGRISEPKVIRSLLRDVDTVVHLAAAVGVGQSMYEIREYIDKNTGDTAALLDTIANEPNNVRKLVVASSMSVYGEGKYRCDSCHANGFPSSRDKESISRLGWEHICDQCGGHISPVSTSEDKPLAPASIYAMSKRHQEEMCLLVGRTYDLPTVALRFFNVYGPRQSLSNPYTGVCSIFLNRILGNKPPYIFEDGKQTRDLIHVRDVVHAILSAVNLKAADQTIINIGTGKPTSMLELAQSLIKLAGGTMRPYISSEFRKGDVRHCYADTTRAKGVLRFSAEISLEKGLTDLVRWSKQVRGQSLGSFEKSLKELKSRNLA
jgi:dTDP-L-rhamnose 4-epimerase